MVRNRIVALLVALLAAALQGVAAQEPSEPVKEFVHSVHQGADAYSTAKRLSSEEDPRVLLEMLHNPEMAPQWTNIAILVGASGHDDMVQPLIDFVHGRHSDIGWSLPAYRGRTSAIMALGYLVHETGNQDAMQYLIDSVHPRAWTNREVWWLLSHPDSERLSLQLSTAAITALAFTGGEAAVGTLSELMDSDNDRLREVAEAMFPEWQEINDTSLAEYYQRDRGEGSIVAAVGR